MIGGWESNVLTGVDPDHNALAYKLLPVSVMFLLIIVCKVFDIRPADTVGDAKGMLNVCVFPALTMLKSTPAVPVTNNCEI